MYLFLIEEKKYLPLFGCEPLPLSQKIYLSEEPRKKYSFQLSNCWIEEEFTEGAHYKERKTEGLQHEMPLKSLSPQWVESCLG